ncbi:MAG: hypothetical protein HOA14_03860 [Planctomycetaceae bacterium]|jgi:hypothetical protein|nr:hypothetical protein [Planctomycetaceae bacterium]MBT4012007.1 hypothetical protein [Planctomycetaceae bacterium]MBT4723971.1 hypothetical protein [Planctomycetaceae bacterium]MBT5884392.1 hypothetical protein [Planctomycetaceae bacterium]MBT6846533.1 hypothetical protein [Planctomycetaceae bacterium]
MSDDELTGNETVKLPLDKSSGQEDQVDQESQQIVAYLDGELDAATNAEIEKRLADDAEFALRLQQLQRAWDLLDDLPRVAGNIDFTRSTVELIAVSAEDDLQATKKRATQKTIQSWLLRSGLIGLAILLGAFLGDWYFGRAQRQLLRDLSVIHQYDEYRLTSDLEFLKQLQDGLFDDPPFDQSPPTQSAPKSLQELSQWPALERAKFQQKQARFELLEENEKRDLRQFQQMLQKDPARDVLNQIMHSYTQWVLALPPGEAKRRFLDLPREERLVEVEKIIREKKNSRFKELLNSRLDLDDLSIVDDWMHGWMKTEQVNVSKLTLEVINTLSEEIQQRISSTQDPANQMRMALFASIENIEMQKWTEMFPQWQQNTDQLLSKISPTARDIYKKTQGEREQLQLVMRWAYYAFLAKRFNWMNVDDRALAKFYQEELSAKDRDMVDRLPAEQYKTTLRRLYFRSKRPPRFFEMNSGNGPPLGRPPIPPNGG